VDRRVEQADDDREGRHDLEQGLEVLLLQGQQTVERFLALFLGVGNDHVDDDRQARRVIEHALGAGQADADGAVLERPTRIDRGVGVGHDLDPGDLVGPAQERDQLLGELRLHGRDLAQVDLTGGPVQRDHVAFLAEHLGPVGVEHRDAGGGAGGGRQAGGDGGDLGLGVQTGEQHLLQALRRHAQQGLGLGDDTLLLHLDRGADLGHGVHLAVEGVLAGAGIAGEAHAGAGVVTAVA